MRKSLLSLALLAITVPASALDLTITAADGKPLPLAMVTIKAERPLRAAADDNGYPRERTEQRISPEITGFAGPDGQLNIAYPEQGSLNLRVRVPGYKDLQQTAVASNARLDLKLEPETDPAALAAQQPANAWFAALDFGGDDKLRKTALEQCGFCHQQGSFFMRRERSEEEWQQVLQRMIGYGARPASELQPKLIETFNKGYTDLRHHPEKVYKAKPWEAQLADTSITEWPIGDPFSQMHDLLLHSSGKVYIGDNLQDRLWEIDPKTGQTVVYKTPVDPDDEIGGMFSGRLKTFPKLETTAGIHSLAESPKDGHIFITPSLQQRLFEFDPQSKTFTVHRFSDGLYPHTVRIDQDDRIALLGKNGQGKSTLSKLLAGKLQPSEGKLSRSSKLRIGYFAQHQVDHLDVKATPLLMLQRISPKTDELTLRNFLGGFGFGGERVTSLIAPFSGGEKARLALALIIWQRPNVLLLDEPTNHLDLSLRHALLVAVQAFEGAVVLVSHDRNMVSVICDELWLVCNGRVERFDGDLDDYTQWLRKWRADTARAAVTAAGQAAGINKPEPKAADTSSESAASPKKAVRSADIRALQQQLAKLEKLMADHQMTLDQCGAQLSTSSIYETARAADLKKTLASQAAAQIALADAEAEWLTKNDELEALTG